MSCLWENVHYRTQYNSPSIEELLLTPQTAGLFHCHGPHHSWDFNKHRTTSLQDPFCHSCVLLSLQGRGAPKCFWNIIATLQCMGKSSFTAHLRMVLPSIAVCHSLALRCSVLWGAPRLLPHVGQVLPTRDTNAKPNQNKKNPSPKTLLCLLWQRDWEREALLSST